MAYEQGGGGGKAPDFTPITSHALSKPYDLTGDMSPEKMSQLDEMLELLFRSTRFSAENISTLESASGTGDVVGPSSATDGRIAEFDGTTGKLIADSGILTADVVTGPASAVTDRVAVFNGTTGKIIKDGGSTIADIVSGGSVVAVTPFSLTEAQLEAMTGSSGVEVVAASGAGFRWHIVSFQIQTVVTTSYTNAPNYVGILTGISFAGLTSGATFFNAAAQTSHNSSTANPESFSESSANPENLGITIRLTGALTGAGSATAKGAIAYYKVPIA